MVAASEYWGAFLGTGLLGSCGWGRREGLIGMVVVWWWVGVG